LLLPFAAVAVPFRFAVPGLAVFDLDVARADGWARLFRVGMAADS
jgi:hypothetical protein